MRDALGVTLGACGHHLPEDSLGLGLFQAPVGPLLEVTVQGGSRHVLEDEVDLLGGVDGLIELDDVLVVELLQQLDLSAHALLALRIQQLVLLLHLDGHLAVGRLVDAEANHSLGSLTDLLAYDVVVHDSVGVSCDVVD